MMFFQCLAVLIYFEAAGEPLPGKLAVAEVVHNRVQSVLYPQDVCRVLMQPNQFSYVKDKKDPTSPPVIYNEIDRRAWEESLWAARKTLNGEIYGLVDGAMWYYNPDKASPKWAEEMKEVVTIGNHRFMER